MTAVAVCQGVTTLVENVAYFTSKLPTSLSYVADIPHVAPSNESEVRTFMWIDSKGMEDGAEQCQQHGYHGDIKVCTVCRRSRVLNFFV